MDDGRSWDDIAAEIDHGVSLKYGLNGAPPTPPVNGEWEDPIPFDNFILPPFPLHALPPWLRSFCAAEAIATQTPPDLPAMLALSACAAAVAKSAMVEVVPGYREPLNLFTATILPPGERKSAVLKEVIAPLNEWEAAETIRLGPAIRLAKQRYALSAKRLEAAESAAARAKGHEREAAELEAADLNEQHAGLKVPADPRLLADDATPEALVSLMHSHNGRMAQLSAEGGIFDMLAGRYSDAPNLDPYLKGHAGDEIRVDRKGRPPEWIPSPALTVGIAVQPAVLEKLSERPMFRGVGLLARFLYALPPSLLGERVVGSPSMPEDVRQGYKRALSQLLSLANLPKPLVLKLSVPALVSYYEFARWVEPQLAEFGELGPVRDWAGKLPGAVIRIAGIFAIDRMFREQDEQPEVDDADVKAALEIGRYLIPHAMAAFSAMGESDDRVADAKQVLRCVRRKKWTAFSQRDAYQALKHTGRFGDLDVLSGALDRLVKQGFLRVQNQASKGPKVGRPASQVFEVNPKATVPQNSEGGSHNA